MAAILPLTTDSPAGDLSRWYTDHLHNSHAAWVFFHRPLAVYRQPFGIARQGIAYRQGAVLWDQMPMAYPPGMFVAFAPLALVGQFVPMSRHAFGVLGVLFTLALAHAAMLALWLALDSLQPGSRAVVWLVGWMLLLRLGLQGFYDAAWIGCAAMMLRAMARGRAEAALGWFGAAALLHFRAAAIAPLGVAALADCVRGKRPDEWPWTILTVVTVAVGISIATFVLMFPATAVFRSHAQNLLQTGGLRLAMVLGSSVLAGALASRWSDAAVGSVVGVCAALAAIDFEPWWWHGTGLILAPAAVGAWRPASRASAARGVLLVWLLCIQSLAFNGSPGDVFVELRAAAASPHAGR